MSSDQGSDLNQEIKYAKALEEAWRYNQEFWNHNNLRYNSGLLAIQSSSNSSLLENKHEDVETSTSKFYADYLLEHSKEFSEYHRYWWWTNLKIVGLGYLAVLAGMKERLVATSAYLRLPFLPKSYK